MKKSLFCALIALMTVTAAHGQDMIPNESFLIGSVKFTMVPVEGGTFMLGHDVKTDDDFSADGPAHEVTVGNFYIGETPVTQALWTEVMGSNPSKFAGHDMNPVEHVNVMNCRQFIAKLSEMTGRNFRFLTEEEWEYAARGGKYSHGYTYAGGNDLEAVAWVHYNSNEHTHPVKQKEPNELGLYDMTGNVWEWTSSGFARYGKQPKLQPTDGGYRFVYRGGAYYTDERFSPVYHRSHGQISDATSYIGLRLAMDFPVTEEPESAESAESPEIPE